jgi:hypothetical protein
VSREYFALIHDIAIMEEFLRRHANKRIRANSDEYYSARLIGLLELVILFNTLRTFHFLNRATIMQHETSNVGKGNVEAVSVAIPAVMRAGGDGKHLEINLILFYFSII